MFEIIDEGNVVFKKDFGIVKEFLYYPDRDEYKYQEQLEFVDYAIFKGDKEDYFVYSILSLPSAPAPDIFSVASFINTNNQVKAMELEGHILRSEGGNFENAKIKDHVYQLVDEKYIISPFFDHYFDVTAYYEIDNNSVFKANKEFIIQRDISGWEKDYQKEKLKKAGSIIMYEKPNIDSASRSINLSENTQIKFIGIRYTNNAALVHLILDNNEGWIDEQDVFPKLRVGPAG